MHIGWMFVRAGTRERSISFFLCLFVVFSFFFCFAFLSLLSKSSPLALIAVQIDTVGRASYYSLLFIRVYFRDFMKGVGVCFFSSCCSSLLFLLSILPIRFALLIISFVRDFNILLASWLALVSAAHFTAFQTFFWSYNKSVNKNQ